MNTFHELVKRSRTVRRYKEEERIPESVLIDLVDTARLTASAGNRQPVRFIICDNKKLNNEIFKLLGWLGYIAEDLGPKEGERPSAYIILLQDNRIRNASFQYDAGIVSQTIILNANYYHIGCCIIGAVNQEKLRNLLNIPGQYDIISVLALGYPLEEVQLEESKDESDVKYWRDDSSVHHVPKLSLDKVLLAKYHE
jgi:nitroreductase